MFFPEFSMYLNNNEQRVGDAFEVVWREIQIEFEKKRKIEMIKYSIYIRNFQQIKK